MNILLNLDESSARKEEACSCYPTPVQEYTFIQRSLESIPGLNKISQPCRLLLTTRALIATFSQPQDQNSAWRTINNTWNMPEHQRCPVAPLYQHFCYCYTWSSLQDMSAVLLLAVLHIYQALGSKCGTKATWISHISIAFFLLLFISICVPSSSCRLFPFAIARTRLVRPSQDAGTCTLWTDHSYSYIHQITYVSYNTAIECYIIYRGLTEQPYVYLNDSLIVQPIK